MKFVCFDTETSDLTPGQIGQLSLIMVDNASGVNVTTAKNYFFSVSEVNPDITEKFGRDVDWYARKSNGACFKDKAQELKDIFSDVKWVAHNLPFDAKFLSLEFWRVGETVCNSGSLDMMHEYRNIVNAVDKNGRVKNPRLEEVVNYLNLSPTKILEYTKETFGCDDTDDLTYHDSRYDTTCLFIVFNILAEIKTVGLENSTWAIYFRND